MKKRILCALIAALMIVMLLPTQAFAADKNVSITGLYVGLSSGKDIDSVDDAISYAVSGSAPAGMKISGSYRYSNKYGKNILTLRIDGTPTTSGSFSFTVSYKNPEGTTVGSTAFSGSVKSAPAFDYLTPSIIKGYDDGDVLLVADSPTKLEYYLGETIDPTGLRVTTDCAVKINKQGKPEHAGFDLDITEFCSISPTIITSDDAGAMSVYVSCTVPCNAQGDVKTYSTYYRISFKYANPNDVIGLAVSSKPTKTTYTVGESLDPAGLGITATMGDGTQKAVTDGYSVSPTSFTEKGEQTVTVTYDTDKTATFSVTVTEAVVSTPPSSVSSSSSSSVPESSSEPESSVPESSESSSVPEYSVPESSSEPESSVPEVVEPEPAEENTGVPFWVWIIVGLVVVAIAAAVGLYIIGKRKLDE